MRRIAPLALLLALVACHTGPSPERIAFLNSLIGDSQTDLVRRLGVPNRTFETGGHTFLAYDQNSTQVIPGPPTPDFYPWGPLGWGWGWPGYSPPTVVQLGCETTFEIADGKVLHWTLRGNAC
jgi:hypothetical protein